MSSIFLKTGGCRPIEYLWALKAGNGVCMTGHNVTFDTRKSAVANALNTKKLFAEAEIVDKEW